MIPNKVRIPCYIVVIAAFVTVVQFVMQAFTPSLYETLGIFIPLIVVNCIVLGRAEAFANKHGVLESACDGLGVGLGFTCSITLLSCVRELFGSGTIFSVQMMPAGYQPMAIMNQVPGGFITLGIMMILVNTIRKAIQTRNSRKEAAA